MLPVKKTPIVEQVINKIRSSIIEGAFEEGSKLPAEQALCKSLNVSRSTLREAFKVLQTMGYVELKPGRGAYVLNATPNATMDVRDWFIVNAPKLTDLMEVRQAIEILAIKTAVKQGSDAEFAEVLEVNEKFIQAVKIHNTVDMAIFDETFHKKLVNMSHNSLLMNLNDMLANAFKSYRSISFLVQKNGENAVGAHKEILAALKAKDIKWAMKSIESHFTMVLVDMEAIIAN